MPKIRFFSTKNIVILAISVVFSLHLFELAIFVSKKSYYAEHSQISLKRMSSALKQGVNYDTRTRWQYIQDQQEEGLALSPLTTPRTFVKSNFLAKQNDQLFPLGGLSKRRTLHCNEYGDYLVFDSDQWGLRNPPEAHSKHVIDLAIVGDSFSMGHCVEKDIAYLLRKSGLATINLAYSGNGPLIELATIREYARQRAPKIVLWIYYEGNDLKDFELEKKSTVLMRYLNPDFSQNIHNKQAQVDKFLDAYVTQKKARQKVKRSVPSIIKLTGLRDLLNKTFKRSKAKNIQPVADMLLFKQVLEQAQTEVSSWGGKMVFVYLPDWTRFAYPDNYAEHHPWLAYRHAVLETAEALNMPIVDTTKQMSLAQKPTDYYPFGLRGHYTEDGYALVADQIIQALLENGLLTE